MLRKRCNSYSDSDSEEAPSLPQLEKIRISFNSQDGNPDYFTVRENIKIQDLVEAFCKKRKIKNNTRIFTCNGKQLPRRGTVTEAGLMDQDEILVMKYTMGA